MPGACWVLLGDLGVPSLGVAALGLFLDYKGPTPTTRDRGRQGLVEAERLRYELQATRRKVVRALQSRVDVLEGRLPSSRLSHEQ